jgi:iron complex outermembrane receptor protein
MNKQPKSLGNLKFAWAVSIFAAAAVGAPVMAQDQEASSAGALEEVIVTATKREETILEVPISISTLTSEDIGALNASGDDIRFLRGRVPSLNIESSFGRLFPRFYIRGWGNTDFDINASQPVSLVYDGVVQENPYLKGFPIFDTEMVEVLRGPQGTLFGRNTPAGVVHVRSRKPSQVAEGYARLGLTETDFNFESAIGGPLDENWSSRFSLKYMKRDDWVTNNFQNQGESLGSHKDVAARFQVMYESEDFSSLFNVHYRDLDGTARLFRANIIKRGSTGQLIDGFDVDSISVDGRNGATMEQWGGMLRLDWFSGPITLTSITGYETYTGFSVGDIDGGYGGVFEIGSGGPGFLPFAAETGDGVSSHRQFTQEFRIASDSGGNFRWQAGVFYFDESLDIYTENYATNFGGGINGLVFQTQENQAAALFGSIDYDVTDDILFKAGIRYSDDEKDYVAERFLSPISFLGASDHLGPIPVTTGDDQVSWDVSVTKFFTDDFNLYVRAASGFRAPSIQGRILFGDTVSVADSETVVSYEIGIKSNFASGRGRMAANYFYYTVDDIQLTAVGGEANFNQVVNGENMTGQGIEADLDYLFTDNFLVSAGISYNHTEIKDSNLSVAPCGSPLGCTVLDPPDPNVPGAVLIDGNAMPQAPRWIFNMTARWSKQTSGNNEFYVFADYFYRDSVNFFLYEAKEFTGPSLNELGLRTGYMWNDGKYEIALFGRNITDEIKLVGGIDFNNLTGFVNEPARWGFEFRGNFF